MQQPVLPIELLYLIAEECDVFTQCSFAVTCRGMMKSLHKFQGVASSVIIHELRCRYPEDLLPDWYLDESSLMEKKMWIIAARDKIKRAQARARETEDEYEAAVRGVFALLIIGYAYLYMQGVM